MWVDIGLNRGLVTIMVLTWDGVSIANVFLTKEARGRVMVVHLTLGRNGVQGSFTAVIHCHVVGPARTSWS